MNPLSVAMPALTNAAPASTPPMPTGGDAAGKGFARCLDDVRQQEHAASAVRSNAKAQGERSARESGAARTNDNAAKPTDTPPKAAADTESATDADGSTAEATRKDAAAPDLATLLPGWTPPSAATTAVDSSGDDSADLLPAGAQAVGATPSQASLQQGLDAQSLSRLASKLTAADAGDAAAASDATPAELRRLTPTDSLTPQQPALVAGAWHATPASLASPSARTLDATPSASLPAPIDHPAFAPSLATQVRWWAQDGVQQAQLTLNPAEMGPVTVTIVVDGRDARIDFRADMAATRSALEASLPALAAALDESGLTLTGGGVHDGQSQQQQQHPALGGSSRGRAIAAARDERASERPGHAPSAARGMVDLIA